MIKNMTSSGKLLLYSSGWLVSYLVFFFIILNPFHIALAASLGNLLAIVSCLCGLGAFVSLFKLGAERFNSAGRSEDNLCIWSENLPDDGEAAEQKPAV